MRILMVTPMPPQPQAPGAIPVLLHAQLAGLVPHHQVTLVTVVGTDPGEWQAVEKLRTGGMEVHAVRLMQPEGRQRWNRRWRLVSTWLRGAFPWRTVWFWEPAIQQTLDRLLAEQRFDVVQVEDNAMGPYQYRTQRPVVFTEHEVRRPRPVDWHGFRHSRKAKWAFDELDWQRWAPYERKVWQRFDRIQVFTPRDASSIDAIAPELSGRVRVNPFCVEIPAVLDHSREESGALLFVGNFTHAPNVDAALWLGHEIMPRLRERLPSVRLSLVGIYPPPAVQALACDDITVTGPVPEIEPYLERSAIVLAPLRIGGGMRMKVLHSMAMGKAVVTTTRGAEGLSTEGAEAPLVIANDAQEIANAVAKLLGDPDARRELGNRARAYVSEHYSPDAYARRLEAIYAELLQGAPKC